MSIIVRCTKTANELLTIKSKRSGIPKSKLIEFAVINYIPNEDEQKR